jgi:uncharacterized membrane protein YecN with MAPEG domain
MRNVLTISPSIMGDTLSSTNRDDPASLKADPLYAAIRTQANFLEITPWALVLAAILELNGIKRSTLNYALATLFVLRVWHGEGGIMPKGRRGLGRLFGYWGSMFWMTWAAVLNVQLSKSVWTWN